MIMLENIYLKLIFVLMLLLVLAKVIVGDISLLFLLLGGFQKSLLWKVHKIGCSR